MHYLRANLTIIKYYFYFIGFFTEPGGG